MSTQSSSLLPKESLLEKLTKTVYLDYVLKAVGVILFSVAFVSSWHSIGVFYRFIIVIAIVMWFVGQRFTKIYRLERPAR